MGDTDPENNRVYRVNLDADGSGPTIFGPKPTYFKRIGDEVGPNLIDGVRREFYKIRMKDVDRLYKNQDQKLWDIHRASGASIAILTDLTPSYHQALLELSARTPLQAMRAKQLIQDAIAEIYRHPFVPVTLMPSQISQETLVIPSQKAAYLFCKKSFLEIEAETLTWLELDGSMISADGTDVIHIQISGLQRNINIARITIERIVSNWICIICYWIWWLIWRPWTIRRRWWRWWRWWRQRWWR